MEKMSTPIFGPKIYIPGNDVLSWMVLGNLSQRANSYRHRSPLKDQVQIPYIFLFIFFFLPFSTSWFLTTYPGIFHIFMAGYFGPSPSLLSRWENNPSVFCFTVAIRKHNSAFMYSKVLMRFNGIVSSLYVHTGNQWQGCEFICWGTFTIPPHKIKTECFMVFWQKSDAYFSKKGINNMRNIISFRPHAMLNVYVIYYIF